MPRTRSILVTILCLSLWSCGDGGTETLPVVTARGKVTLMGTGLDGATLVFAPQEGKHVGTALSGADGEFQVQMNSQEGAVPGQYKVIVTKFLTTPAKFDAEGHEETSSESKLITPEKYSKLETTDLLITVPEDGSETLQVDLK